MLPALLTTNGMLIAISSAYRRPVCSTPKHRDHFGKDEQRHSCRQRSDPTFNQTVDEAAIAALRAADPIGASQNGTQPSAAIWQAFSMMPVIDRAINYARPLELPPSPRLFYRAFTDPSGGSMSGDAYSSRHHAQRRRAFYHRR